MDLAYWYKNQPFFGHIREYTLQEVETMLEWEGFEIKASDVAGNASGSALTQRQVWITAFQGVDTGIIDESGFTVINDALTNPTEF